MGNRPPRRMPDVSARRAARLIICTLAALLLWPLGTVSAAPDTVTPPEPEVTAVAGAVVELSTGAILWGRDLHTVRAPASLTKMMTGLVAIDLAPLDTKITIQQSDLVGESSMGLENGETLSLEALLYGMLLPSGNDAAAAIARALGAQPGDTSGAQSVQHFVDKMNAKAKALGTKETHLVNPHGLDEAGHVSSAYDLAIIGAAFARNATLMRIAGTVTYDGFGHTVHTTNKLLYDGRYPSVIGGKTGQTDEAGYNLVEIAARNGRQILTVELGTTADAFWTDAIHLLDYGYALPPSTKTQTAGQGGAFTTPDQSTTAPREAIPLLDAASGPPATMNAASNAPPTVLTLPLARRSNIEPTVRYLLLLLLAAAAGCVLYLRRAAVRRALAEARSEWQRGIADPPHLVDTITLPLIAPSASPGVRSVSSRWTEMGMRVPRAELEVARAYALQAVRQARGGSRAESQQAFKQAVSLHPRLEWGALPGFWEMPPASYADLATVMIDAGYAAVARSMLTVAALAHPRHPDLHAVAQRLNRRGIAPQPPASPAWGG